MTDYQKDIAEVINNQTEAEEHAQLRCELHTKECDRRDKIWSKRYWFSMIFVAVISGILGGLKVYVSGPDFMGMVPNSYGEASYKELLMASQKNDRQIIWFDRKRMHSDSGFAKVDDKFPAQYEVWQGAKLIERWHWFVESDEKTHQYKDYIFRCVANYDHESNYVGFTQYQMRDYPTGDASIDSERLTVLDSLRFKLNITTGLIELKGPEMKVSWVMGKLNSTQKVIRGFPYEEDNLNLVDLIQNENDYNYLTHLAKTFDFLNESILDPYENKIDFIQLTENLPTKTKATWDNFAKKINENKKATLDYVDSQFEQDKKDNANINKDIGKLFP